MWSMAEESKLFSPGRTKVKLQIAVGESMGSRRIRRVRVWIHRRAWVGVLYQAALWFALGFLGYEVLADRITVRKPQAFQILGD